MREGTKIIIGNGLEAIGVAVAIWGMASCEYKEHQANEETKRLELQLKYNQDINFEQKNNL